MSGARSYQPEVVLEQSDDLTRSQSCACSGPVEMM